MSDLLRVVRWLLRRPQPVIGRDRAIQLACKEFDERGWPYEQPKAIERLNAWVVMMDGQVRDGPVVIINQQTGKVENRGPRLEAADKVILYELRRAAKDAVKAGKPVDFVTFNPPTPSGIADFAEKGPILAELRNRDGDRVLFTAGRLFVEDHAAFFSIPYRDIADFHWMKPDYDQSEEMDLKRTLEDQIVLEDDRGQYFELRKLGCGFDATWNILVWLLRGRLPYRRDQAPRC